MIGHRVIRLKSVDSTNTFAAGLAGGPDAHGTVVVADVQTAGRGQYGRSWLSEPGESLLASVVVVPPPALRRPVVLIAWAAVALAEAVFSLTGHQVRIKWPNDLLIRGKKVCGILTEAAHNAVVVGFGLNRNQTREVLDARGLHDATSLAQASGNPATSEHVLATALLHLDREWRRLSAGELAPVEAEWKWRIGLLGRAVSAERSDGTAVLGRLSDMGFDGIEIATVNGGVVVLTPESVRSLRAL